jgi:SAM-dependent methyltransferase
VLRSLKAAIRRAGYRVVWPLLSEKLGTNDGRVLANPWLSAKLLPLQEQSDHYVIASPECSAGGAASLPVPPRALWSGYGASEDEYLDGGRAHMDSMLTILRRAGMSPEAATRVLDFGCAAGRMLRFYPRTPESEVWGVDISAKHVVWCQNHLSPPFLFATTTTLPHLPFEDGYFQLIYSGSIFTHLTDLADAWLLELRRVSAREGYIYVTIHDRHTLALLSSPGWEWAAPLKRDVERIDARTGVLRRPYTAFAFDAVHSHSQSQVFYDAEHLAKKWSRLVRVLSVTPMAYGYQTALLLQKA